MFKNYKNLGYCNPYYFNNNGQFVIEQNLAGLLEKYNKELRIDSVAIVELLNKNFILADRTLLKGINKTPWLAKPNEDLSHWKYAKVPQHGLLDVNEKEIAKTLFEKICNEIQSYVGTHKKVGVLLSGGMDSRMIAGALDYLIKTKKIEGIEITGLTWGNEGSRDVVYAKEISRRMNWKWKHYTVTAKNLLDNITETAINGCEYSPIHLHAIPQIRDDNEDLEVIIAGSYGDSVGRAEYSGTKLEYIKPIVQKISNVCGVVDQKIVDDSKQEIESDIKRYHKQFPEGETYMQNELDYQLHYMRKQLNACMHLLNIKSEFHQIYTHPDVYGYMWSIKPARRNDLVYKYMLTHFFTKLNDIPWARTGLPYGQKKGVSDNLCKTHHSYVNIIQNEIYEDIKNMVLSEEITKLHIFNRTSLNTLLNLIKSIPPNNMFYLEKIIWIASIAKMVKIYNIPIADSGIPDKQKSVFGSFYIVMEYCSNILRKRLAPLKRKLPI